MTVPMVTSPGRNVVPLCACGHLDHLPAIHLKDLRCPTKGCGHGRYLALDHTRPCRIVAGVRDRDGYVRVSHGRTAHRRSYEDEVRDLQKGETLDHVCHTRSGCRLTDTCPHRGCEAPWHLEPVTQSENSKRRWGKKPDPRP
jgi:hypothetical protein